MNQPDAATGSLVRTLGWRDAFWLASGAPALVLFSIGGIASPAGKLAILVWAVSITMGVIQSFTYAEIAGLYPDKSGGASIYGAGAWVRYAKIVAPLSVWCNWVAWTSVLSLGASIAAGYILDIAAPAASSASPGLRSWSLLHGHIAGISFSFNAAFFVGAGLMLAVFGLQHGGVGGTAKTQRWLGLAVIVPLAIVGLVPILQGKIAAANFLPLAPPSGQWDLPSWTALAGALFMAGWSTYGFETAVCYTREFRDPARDTFRAIFSSGLLCFALFVVVPFTFQGVLGPERLADPAIADGSGVARALAFMVGGGATALFVLVLLMVLAVLLAVMTGMAGSSRTLYQGSLDGLLPRYLSRVNAHGAPVAAMWTDLLVNLVILAVAVSDAGSFYLLLAISNCCYIIFNFLNLNAGWIHRLDARDQPRPYRAPLPIIASGGILAFVNAALMGAGAKIWGPSALWLGLSAALLIVPIFCFRHYIQDVGRFPEGAFPPGPRRAGKLPYLALAGGLAVVLAANWLMPLS